MLELTCRSRSTTAMRASKRLVTASSSFWMNPRRCRFTTSMRRVLGCHGGRRQFLARLGTEVSDILDEFLTFALDHENLGPAWPAVVHFDARDRSAGGKTRAGERTQRSPDHDRPRVKGSRSADRVPGRWRVQGLHPFAHAKASAAEQEPGEPMLACWFRSAISSNSSPRSRCDTHPVAGGTGVSAATLCRHDRAADRLTVLRLQGIRPNTDTWHAMISTAMTDSHPHVSAATFSGPDGTQAGIKWRVPRMSAVLSVLDAQNRLPGKRPSHPASAGRCRRASSYLARLAHPVWERSLMRARMTPGRLSAFRRKGQGGSFRGKRGRLLHRMLQTLPDVPRGEQADAAVRYAKRAASFWPEAERQQLGRSRY